MQKILILTLWRIVLILALSVVAYASLAPSSGGAMFVGMDKLMHGLTYAGLYILAWLAFRGAVFRWSIHISLLGFGVALEFLQAQTGYRFMEAADVVANTTGTGLGNLMLSLLGANLFVQRSAVSETGESIK